MALIALKFLIVEGIMGFEAYSNFFTKALIAFFANFHFFSDKLL